MMFKEFGTADYVRAFSGIGLYGNLFLMKLPYLIFDFAIAGILLKLASSKESAGASYRLWMLNIVVLHSAYCIGKSDLIPAFFVISAVLAAVKKRPYFSVVLLSMGGATKLFPYILILPAALLLGSDWKKRLSLLFAAALATAIVYLPFYLSSGGAFLRFFMLSGAVRYSGIAGAALPAIFIGLYLLVSINALKDSRFPNPERKILHYFLIVMFLSYAAAPVRFRYLVSATPLLALVIPQHKKFGAFILFIILTSAFLWLSGRSLQMGLFAPLDPEYFPGLPSIHEIVGRFVNIEIMHKIAARALLLGFFGTAFWVWRIKSNNESIIFNYRR
jgi:hypothetical protein